jgi:uroporphyrin-III C-methyltransferase / precorrin-2 dehydrogenase / sirohydrochlorin ferrochelatase
VRYYPVFLDLDGQRAVVLGGGAFATEKVALLLDAGARVTVVSAKLSKPLQSLAGNGVVEVVPRDYQPGDLAGARLAVDASENEEINRQAWEEAERSGVLINVVDRPAQCRFIAPAIVRRDPVVIAISTSGESPFLASALRARIERAFGREWGPFTALVGRIRRELRSRGVSIADQTKVYRRLLTSDIRELLRAGRTDEAEHSAAALAQTTVHHPGRVALVGAGPGDPELLTLKARELIGDAGYVLHDALVAPETLALAGPNTKLEAVGKRGGAESSRQEEITARLIELARSGHFVVRLKGGDPFVFGRGGEELNDLIAASVDVVVVPGITSAFAAPASAGIPATMRGVSSSVAITTAQGGDSLDRIADLARAADTLIVLMARSNLKEVAGAVARSVGGSRPAALVSNATLPEERSVTGTIADIAHLADRDAITTPATLIVGEVVRRGQLAARSVASIAASS